MSDLLSDSVPGGLDSDAVGTSRAARGDRFGDLLEAHRPRLLRIASIRLGPRVRREVESVDIVQETFCAALERASELVALDAASLVAWLARVAENRIRDRHDRLTAARRDVARDVPIDTAMGAMLADSGEPTPSQDAARQEVRDILDEAVAELPPQYRDVILMRDYCGAGWEQVTRELGRDSLHATQQLHQRAWIKLRRIAEPRLRR